MGVERRRESPLTCQTSTEIYQAASATEERVVGSVCSLRLVIVLQPGSIAASTRRHRALVGQERRGIGWCGRHPIQRARNVAEASATPVTDLPYPLVLIAE
jgi:hypothetical protein